MAKKKVGLYLGLSSIGAVATEGKAIVASAKYDLTSVEEEAKVESLNEEVRWQALINKILREIRAEERDVYVSLTDKDFIFRSLEMPIMGKKNIGSSLVFEIEKYIPFKIDELAWDYSYTRYPKEKKLNISFVGIRENNIFRVQEMFTQLNLNPVVIEPSSLSLIKILKSSKQFSAAKNFALLDVSEAEAYLTFFYDDLPVFNQYITVPKKGNTIDNDKFVESVRLSYQYFKREFRAYELNKFIIITAQKDDAVNSLLTEELQISVDMVSPYELVSDAQAGIETIKAAGVVSESTYKFKPVFKKAEQYAEEQAATAALGETPLRPWVLAGLAAAGLIATIVLWTILGNETSVLQYKLEKADAAIERPKEVKGLDWPQVNVKLKAKENQFKTLKNLAKNSPINSALAKLGTLRPKGVWFEGIDLDYRDGKYSLALTGYIFLGDAFSERSGVDNFVANLKNSPEITKSFTNVNLVSLEQRTLREYSVTYFTIRLN
ncbi:MAG: pilus assembly protein PilM [Candidatus Omnitrophota bacterium]